MRETIVHDSVQLAEIAARVVGFYGKGLARPSQRRGDACASGMCIFECFSDGQRNSCSNGQCYCVGYQQLPDVLAALNEFLEPVSAALDQLHAAIASLQGIQALTGQNLTIPGAAFRIPVASASARASASASAIASASASASASANASVAMSANAMMAMRLNAVGIGLGFPLPGKLAGLDAALRLTAGLPPLNLPASLLHSISSKIAALSATAKLLGGNLTSPNAGMLLNSALTTAQANLTAMVSGSATGNASLQASTAVSAAANAAASLNASAILAAAANLNLSEVPNLQPLAASMSLSAHLQTVTGALMLASKQCDSCVHKF